MIPYIDIVQYGEQRLRTLRTLPKESFGSHPGPISQTLFSFSLFWKPIPQFVICRVVSPEREVSLTRIQLTVARSFWLRPLACRACIISFPVSKDTLSCFNSSVSRSSLAVFLVVTCCLLVAAPTAMQRYKLGSGRAWTGNSYIFAGCPLVHLHALLY